MNWKLLVWGALATFFLALAVRSWQHYSRYQKAARSLRYKKMRTLMQYRSIDPVKAYDERALFLGNESEALGKMIPFEIAGFLAAAIAAILELL